MESQLLLTFNGPYNLDPDSPHFLFASEPYSWKGGLYVIAWPYNGKHFVHYIGETRRYLAYRIFEHLRGTCSGAYYIYNKQYLDAACANPGQEPSGSKKYLYGPPNPDKFCREFVPNLGAGWGAEITAYLQRLRFFLGPVAGASKQDLLAMEAVLTHRAYEGPCRYVLDSPPKDASAAPEAMRQLHVEVAGGTTIHGVG